MLLPAIIFPGLGLPELIIILVIVLVIFGPRKLPEIGKALGSTIRELRKSSQGEEAKPEAKEKVEEAETKQAEDPTSSPSS